jgi:hypothetical protein
MLSNKTDHTCRNSHYRPHRLKSGFPNTAGKRSSRNRKRCARKPIVRPPSLLIGTMASAATCHAPATYDNHRRGDRVEDEFAALHMSAYGT